MTVMSFLFYVVWFDLMRWSGFVLTQVWECNCGGEYRKGVAGSYLPEDTCCFWFWNLRSL